MNKHTWYHWKKIKKINKKIECNTQKVYRTLKKKKKKIKEKRYTKGYTPVTTKF